MFAVGDLHGCVDELCLVLDAIEAAPQDTVLFVGDYVDRGPSPKGVIDRLIALRDSGGPRCVFLKGNHEDMFLSWLGEPGRHGDAFLLNGGRGTLQSYGLTPAMGGEEACGSLPPSHLDFLRRLAIFERRPPFLFVHAGISPLRGLEEQDEEDLLWIREEFIRNRHRLAETVVFGHTPHREVVWHLPWKIGIDTGCVYGNKLTCLELTEAVLFEARRGAREVTRRSVAEEMNAVSTLKTPADGYSDR
ncbi:MAG: metallophosphoesterase family protein [Candidatus Binatia bacterium]